jgi:hypothetical protein
LYKYDNLKIHQQTLGPANFSTISCHLASCNRLILPSFVPKLNAMEHLPFYVSLLFELTVALTIYLFYRAAHSSKAFLLIVIVWVAIQALLGLSDFYYLSKNAPPKLPLLVGPPTALIIILFLIKKGRSFIDKLSISNLTLVHSVALLVEPVLYFLFVYKYAPKAMTFEGSNFDILSGLTAPIAYYFGFVNKKLNRGILITWNLICLGLVINASRVAVLSMPNFGVIGAEQPDIALGLFPYILLPAVIVPIVLFAHLASIRNLVIKRPSPNLVLG